MANMSSAQSEAAKLRYLHVGMGLLGLLRRFALYRATLQQNFETAFSAKAIEERLSTESFQQMFDEHGEYRKPEPQETPRILRLGNEMEASGYASNVYASSVILIANNMLQEFAAYIGARNGAALRCGPDVSGVPFSIALWAAGNAIRHHDEWSRKIKPPFTVTVRARHKQAFASIDPLRQVVPSTFEMTYFSIAEVLAKLSDESFEYFVERVFSTAKAFAVTDALYQMAWDWGQEMADKLARAAEPAEVLAPADAEAASRQSQALSRVG
jgi:hypothetical protein